LIFEFRIAEKSESDYCPEPSYSSKEYTKIGEKTAKLPAPKLLCLDINFGIKPPRKHITSL
jgi:hypothetical protein